MTHYNSMSHRVFWSFISSKWVDNSKIYLVRTSGYRENSGFYLYYVFSLIIFRSKWLYSILMFNWEKCIRLIRPETHQMRRRHKGCPTTTTNTRPIIATACPSPFPLFGLALTRCPMPTITPFLRPCCTARKNIEIIWQMLTRPVSNLTLDLIQF